ncbi:MAG: glycosyltransferase [Limnospira sp.]
MPEKSWPNHQRQNPTRQGTTGLFEMHQNQRDCVPPNSTRRNSRFPLRNIRRLRNLGNGPIAGRPRPPQPDPPPSDSLSVPPQCYRHRRRKAAVVLTAIWGGTIALHLISWGIWLLWGLGGVLTLHALRVLFADSQKDDPDSDLEGDDLPFVSLLVAAKNEEAVIGNLVKNLCNLNYPAHCYELWVIDDNSSDRTPAVLDELAERYRQLNILRRDETATGGKSGALNQVLPLTRGEIVGVFDADAQVAPDLLRHVVPEFRAERVGAVQLQKAIANASFNFWTRSQAAEMALDAFFQKQRIAVGGIGELRGNGEFIRRRALETCGGWCEETITDDLDLTLRLHLDRWDIAFLDRTAVFEEGVTRWLALWHQRNRWAEGGYQRYLDYGKFLLGDRLNFGKKVDLFGFVVTQYLLPMAAIPDLLLSAILRRPPVTTPITLLALSLSLFGMFVGLRRSLGTVKPLLDAATPAIADPSPTDGTPPSSSLVSYITTLFQTVRGTVYMFHWLIVVASTTVRISVRPKRLKWVKTVHQGTPDRA